jgi:sec-independent protein translocase protein TatB
MFDIGFLEIVVILIITLIVVGPERMPEIARKAGQFIAKTKNFINSVKDDSDLRETVRELQQTLDMKEEQQRFEHIQKDLYRGLDDLRDEIDFNQLQRPFGQPVEPTPQQMEQARTQLDSTNDVKTSTLNQPNTAQQSNVNASKTNPTMTQVPAESQKSDTKTT